MNTIVREFGAQLGSSPVVRIRASPPVAGTMQTWKSRICDVKAIHLPPGDQSGSLGLTTSCLLY
ncbi:MAG: hypothetical protein N3G20_07995, partial [Verrucomicrobiae bacterium]|nr:hypothetical protein [Verrucomicrobiae bacterium]